MRRQGTARSSRGLLTAGALLSMLASAGISAQAVAHQAQDTAAHRGDSVQVAPAGMIGGFDPTRFRVGYLDSVQVTPAVTIIDPKAHTANFQLSNPGPDTVHLELSMQAVPFRPTAAGKDTTGPKGTAAGAADSSRADTSTVDAAVTRWSLVPWVRQLTRQLTLAPHETRTIPVRLVVPSHVPSGDYRGYVVVWHVSVGDNQSMRMAAPTPMPGGIGVIQLDGVAVQRDAVGTTKLTLHVP